MLRLCLQFVFVRTKMEILAFEFMILFCTVFLYFANFPILATQKSQCNKYKGFFGGKKCNFTWIEFYCNFFSSPLVNDRQPTYLTNLVKMKFHLD